MTFGDDFDENASYEIHKLYGYLLRKLEAPGGKKAYLLNNSGYTYLQKGEIHH
jgi:hypothetical protein